MAPDSLAHPSCSTTTSRPPSSLASDGAGPLLLPIPLSRIHAGLAVGSSISLASALALTYGGGAPYLLFRYGGLAALCALVGCVVVALIARARLIGAPGRTSGLPYVLHAILMGVAWSLLGEAFPFEGASLAFAMAFGGRGVLALVGFVIERDLSRVGVFVLMAMGMACALGGFGFLGQTDLGPYLPSIDAPTSLAGLVVYSAYTAFAPGLATGFAAASPAPAVVHAPSSAKAKGVDGAELVCSG